MSSRLKNGNTELTEKQQEDLKNVYLSIDNDINIVNSIIHKDKIDIALKFLRKNLMNSLAAFLVIVLLIVMISNTIILTEKTKYNNINIPEVDDCITEVSISTNETNTDIQCKINKICISTDKNYININNTNWLYSNINIKDNNYSIDNIEYTIDNNMELNNIDLSKYKIYLQSINNNDNASKEIIISKDKPVNVDINTINKISERYFEYNGNLENKAYINSYDSMFIMLIEKLAGGTIDNTTLKNNIYGVENSATKCNIKETFKMKVILGNNRRIDFSSINNFMDNTEFVYNKDTNIFRVRNCIENVDYIYIFSLNNMYINCNEEEFKKTDNIYVFKHKEFDNINSYGYNTYLFILDNSKYCIKIDNINHEYIRDELLRQLGIA